MQEWSTTSAWKQQDRNKKNQIKVILVTLGIDFDQRLTPRIYESI